MKKAINITIPIVPKAQMRARHRIVKTKDGRTFSTTYKAKEQQTEEQKFMAMLYQHRPPLLIEGPIWLRICAFFPVPRSKSKRWKAEALAGEIRPTKKPDLDNLAKFLKDCLTGIFWRDDAQIVEYLAGTGKWYSDRPRWEITIIHDDIGGLANGYIG